MAAGELKVKVSIRWWVPVYLNSLILFCRVMGTEPDFRKVERLVKRGIAVTTK